jgi:hypothetical protein
MTPGGVQMLQRAYGNRAVTRLLPHRSARLPIQAKLTVGAVGDQYEREADQVADQVMSQPPAISHQPSAAGNGVLQRDDLSKLLFWNWFKKKKGPKGPSISVEASPGSKWGTHASVYLAKGQPGKLEHYKIDLVQGKLGDEGLGSLAEGSRVRLGVKDEDKGVEIRIKSGLRPRDEPYKTWRITPEKADRAYDRAVKFQKNQSKYWYSPKGIGWRGHNCATFAEIILKAAGVKATAGLIYKTPSELLTGKKWGLSELVWQLIPEAQQAFATAADLNEEYGIRGNWARKYMPASHQKKLVNLKKSTEGNLIHLVRAFVLGQYAEKLEKIKNLPLEEKRKARNKKYLPEALKAKAKYAKLLGKGMHAPETKEFLKNVGFTGGTTVTEEEQEIEPQEQEPQEKGRIFKIAGEAGTPVQTFNVDDFMQSLVLVEGGQLVEVLDPNFAVGSTDDDELVRIRFKDEEEECEGRVWAKDLEEVRV